MKLPMGENFHDAYDAIVGAGKRENKMVDTHDHSECLHEELKFCSKCDLTYCKKCLREWGTCRLSHYYTIPYTTWTPPTYTYSTSTTTSDSRNSNTVVYDMMHLHN